MSADPEIKYEDGDIMITNKERESLLEACKINDLVELKRTINEIIISRKPATNTWGKITNYASSTVRGNGVIPLHKSVRDLFGWIINKDFFYDINYGNDNHSDRIHVMRLANEVPTQTSVDVIKYIISLLSIFKYEADHLIEQMNTNQYGEIDFGDEVKLFQNNMCNFFMGIFTLLFHTYERKMNNNNDGNKNKKWLELSVEIARKMFNNVQNMRKLLESYGFEQKVITRLIDIHCFTITYPFEYLKSLTALSGSTAKDADFQKTYMEIEGIAKQHTSSTDLTKTREELKSGLDSYIKKRAEASGARAKGGKSKKHKQTRKNKGKKSRKVKGHSNKKSRKLMGGTDLCAKVGCSIYGDMTYNGNEYKPTSFTGFCNSGDINMDNTLQLKEAVGMRIDAILNILMLVHNNELKQSHIDGYTIKLVEELNKIKNELKNDDDFKKKLGNTYNRLKDFKDNATPCSKPKINGPH